MNASNEMKLIKETDCEDMDYINPADEVVQWWAALNVGMKFRNS